MEAYTTGAYIVPMLVNGEYRWVVSGFGWDDTFIDGDAVNAQVSADTAEGLVEEFED